MKILYNSIIFDMKKYSQIFLKFLCTFQEKRQRVYKISGQAKTFRRAMLAHLQGIFPSAGGTPCHFFFYFFLFGNKCLVVFLCIGVFICIGLETLFLPYAGFFLFLIWDGSWSYLIVLFFNWQNNCTCLFTHFKNNTQLRQSCNKIHCIQTWVWLTKDKGIQS